MGEVALRKLTNRFVAIQTVAFGCTPRFLELLNRAAIAEPLGISGVSRSIPSRKLFRA
jgi:hypothetical protein